ncbi:helix-turn-helix domain-containing protein [Lachnospiraceae bacterium 47-T17]
MQGQTVRIISQAIRYIEEHLHEKMDLDMVASALHYSKYHLHRIFTKTVGLTIHDYAKRRQLTEAAKLLVFSAKPIIEIALMSGYESQQAFTDIFKAMYKTSPAEFRETENFYPLQLEIYLKEELVKMDLTKDNIKFATPEDADDWMELVSLTIDGYPCLDKKDYAANLHQYIADKKALILREGAVSAKPKWNAATDMPLSEVRGHYHMAIGVMGFSQGTGSIDFLAVHPQYRHLGITKLFLDKLADELLYGKEITLTTYRAGDKADTGWREEYRRLGFAERELLVEYGYPTQRFVLPPKNKEETENDRNTEKPVSREL